MYKFTQIAAALLVGASLSLSAFAASAPAKAPAKPLAKPPVSAAPARTPEKIFVKVNGVSIPQNLADTFISGQISRGAPDSPELRSAVREELIRRELLAQQAKNAGLDKRSDVAAQVEAAKQEVLIRGYVQQYIEKNPIKDEQLQAEYNRIKTQVGNTEYKTRHILVKEESEAKAIVAELKKDANKFGELAKQSTDPGSKDNGGDLGWGPPGNYVKPFSDALIMLEKGRFTEIPVHSQFGYHVILLEDTRPLVFPPFEEIKPRVLQQMQQQQLNAMVDKLRASAKVE
ncbi:MAG: peptidylprolyl isomerase [Candidatus Accumulibacter sp.]|jgi:peptidyl-prolyl cis-trans isomerase C|nr:peptidylprolyl isomerase [Accumulibacter sp.]